MLSYLPDLSTGSVTVGHSMFVQSANLVIRSVSGILYAIINVIQHNKFTHFQ